MIRAIQQFCETLPKLQFVPNQLFFFNVLVELDHYKTKISLPNHYGPKDGRKVTKRVGTRDASASKNGLLVKKDFKFVLQGVTWYVARQVCKSRRRHSGWESAIFQHQQTTLVLSLRTSGGPIMVHKVSEYDPAFRGVFRRCVSPSYGLARWLAWLGVLMPCLFRLQMRVMWFPSCLWCGSPTTCVASTMLYAHVAWHY